MNAVATSEARNSELLRHPIRQSLKRNNRKMQSRHIVFKCSGRILYMQILYSTFPEDGMYF